MLRETGVVENLDFRARDLASTEFKLKKYKLFVNVAPEELHNPLFSEDIELNADDVNAAWPAIIASGYPSEDTVGKLGQFYIMNTAPYAEYICTEINEVEGVKKYTWKSHLTDIVVENNTIYGASLSVVPENHEIKILV